MTLVVVTHEPDIARFARRILRFLDGRLISDVAVDCPADAEAILADLPLEAEEP
jgi:putative ABC transport system ATP-binding protein